MIRSLCGLLFCICLLPALSNAAITTTGDAYFNGSSVLIAQNSSGMLAIDGGSQLSSSQLTMGSQNRAGVAVAQVSGFGTSWTLQSIIVQQPLLAKVEVLDGGYLRTQSLVNQASPQMSIVLSGEFSQLEVTSYFEGQNGPVSSIDVLQGATLNLQNTSLDAGPEMEITLDDGTIFAQEFTNAGRLSGDGDLYLGYNSTNGGQIAVGAEQRLAIHSTQQDSFQNAGEINIHGGEFSIDIQLDNNAQQGPFAAGKITLEDGVARFGYSESQSSDLLNNSTLAAIGGTSDVHGRVLSAAGSSIAATNQSVLRFHDAVEMIDASFSVFGGSRAVFLDDLNVTGGAFLAQLPGQPGNEAFGFAEVVGALSFFGQITVTGGEGLAPAAGDVYPLVTAAGGVTGEATLAAAPALPAGLAWDLLTDANSISLAVVDALPGDFNNDGTVDAADYAVWRNGLGDTYQPGDYDLWREHFGQSASAVAAPALVAPEPAAVTCGLVLLTTAVSLSGRRTS